MNHLTFVHDAVRIRLDRLECVKEFDQDGHSEPYLWTAFLRADAGTLARPGKRVEVHVPLEDESGRDLFGDAGKGVRPGDVLQIPEVAGRHDTTLKALSVGEDVLMLAGFVVVLLERDSTPAHAIRVGHRMFGQALREEINAFVDGNLRFPEPDEIDAIRDAVSKRVRKAIRSELSWYHVFIKQDDLVAFLGGGDTLFTAERIAQLRNQGPQSFRTALRGTETFPAFPGAHVEFEHHYDLLWSVEVVGSPEVVAPVHAPLVERVEAAGAEIRRLDARVRELAAALRSADDERRPPLQSKIDRLTRVDRTRAVRDLALAWESFMEAEGDADAASAADSAPILLRRGFVQGFVCQRKSKLTGKCFHGFTKLAGCTEDCGVATIPEFERLELAFHLRVAGRLVDDIGGGPIEGMEVHLFLPNLRRHVARTAADGSFTIDVGADVDDAGSEPEHHDFGVLRTIYDEAVVEETGRIAIVCHLTEAFRMAYPHLDRAFVPVREDQERDLNGSDVARVHTRVIRRLAAPLAAIVALASGCDDATSPQPSTGSIRVAVATTGVDVDPDGFFVQLAGARRASVPASGAVTISNISPGSHSVGLDDLAANCAAIGDNPRTATVVAGETTVVGFAVECTVNSGSVRVTARTNGVDLDADGYGTSIEDENHRFHHAQVPTNGTVTIDSLPGGAQVVRFDGVAANCDAADPNPRSLDLAAGDTADIVFDVACVPVTRLAFSVQVSESGRDIYAINSNGTGLAHLTWDPAVDDDPTWSPDGSRIAFTSERDGRHIYAMNADGSGVVQLTSGPFPEYRPAWSPDGSRIAFVSEPDQDPEIYVMSADGTDPVRLTNQAGRDDHPAWSPDGGRIAFVSTRDQNAEIYVMNADGTGAVRLTNTLLEDIDPAWSPDGRRIAFARACESNDISCVFRIMTMNADGSAVAPLFGTIGVQPAWSPDGRSITVSGHNCNSDFYYYYDPPDCRRLGYWESLRIVRSDGSNIVNLAGDARNPAWQPLAAAGR